MAEYVTVVRELQRMCDENNCAECPITKYRHEGINCDAVNCDAWMGNHPEEVERIVMKWAAENPIVTNRMKFREVFGMDLVVTEDNAEWLDQEYKGGKNV